MTIILDLVTRICLLSFFCFPFLIKCGTLSISDLMRGSGAFVTSTVLEDEPKIPPLLAIL